MLQSWRGLGTLRAGLWYAVGHGGRCAGQGLAAGLKTSVGVAGGGEQPGGLDLRSAGLRIGGWVDVAGRGGFVGGAGGILGGLGAAAGGGWKIGRLAGDWMVFDILINLLVRRGRVLWFFQMDAVGPFALICRRAGVGGPRYSAVAVSCNGRPAWWPGPACGSNWLVPGEVCCGYGDWHQTGAS